MYKQCVATQHCDFNPMKVCPDAFRFKEDHAPCAETVNQQFIACPENCLNCSNTAFGCPLQHIN